MKTSSSYALKRLVTAIHPQLPLDARDSRRLLAVLNETFRKQLDKQYPPPPQSSTEFTGRHVKPISFDVSRAPQTPSSHVSTSEHLKSILENPLFVHRAHWSAFKPGAKENIHPAVLTFRDLAARGAADLDSATKCLTSVLLHVRQSKSGKEKVASTLAGSEVLAWLHSSGEFESQHFKKDSTLLRALVACLVAEGRHDVPEAWLCRDKMLSPHNSDRYAINVDWRKGVVSGLIHAMLVFHDGQGHALQAFSRCLAAHVTNLTRSGSLTNELSTETTEIFEAAGSRLIKILTESRRKISVSEASYNKWIVEIPHWTSTSLQTMALLRVHHPYKPDASHALSYLGSSDAARANTCAPPVRRQHIKLCVDAAHLLLTQNNTEASTWVINYVRNNFPETKWAADARGQSSGNAKGLKAREGVGWGNFAFG